METKKLLARWDALLNELGVRDIEGRDIFTAMEATNASMRQIDRASAA